MADSEKRSKVVVVQGPLDLGRPSKPKFRIAHRDGKRVQLRVVDADSPTFGADFAKSFAANVRRARSENRNVKPD
jgi:hypothetical protein